MNLNAVAVERLIEKGGFEPRVAMGIAAAIETSMTQAQFVTVPILDVRFKDLDVRLDARFKDLDVRLDARFKDLDVRLDARFKEIDARFKEFDARLKETELRLELKIAGVKSELVRWVFVVMLGNVALNAVATALLHVFQHSP
jgi:hypothetical protein